MGERKRPLKRFLIQIIDGLGLGVPLRNTVHEMRYLGRWRTIAANRRFRRSQKPSEPPFPPARLVYRVAAHFDVEQFNRTGRWAASFIDETLRRNGFAIGDFPAVLDFGCGCGRVFRHWAHLAGPKLYGCDYQRTLVRWCRRHLRFGSFERNGLHRALRHEPGSMGFIYAISVFTHLDLETQRFWVEELDRILMNKGALLLTVHGTTRLAELSGEERRQFEEGRPIVHQARYSGANVCATYLPQRYVQDGLCRRFELLEFLPGGARDANQDVYLFRKG